MLYPININLNGKHCIVIGGGEVANRKTKRLLQSGAIVTVISKEFNNFSIKNHKNLTLIKKEFEDKDLELNQFFLIFSATDNKELNSRISSLAEKKNVLCNIADKPEFCSFYLPSIFQTEFLQISVSTQGKCPALSKFIRKWIETLIPRRIDEFIKKVRDYRNIITKKSISYNEKRDIMDSYIEDQWKKIND